MKNGCKDLGSSNTSSLGYILSYICIGNMNKAYLESVGQLYWGVLTYTHGTVLTYRYRYRYADVTVPVPVPVRTTSTYVSMTSPQPDWD